LNMWTVTQATKAITSGTATYSFDATYVDLLEVVLRNSSGTDFTLSQMSRSEYLTIPNKTSSGQPSQYFFDRQVTPTITLWSTPDASYTLVYYYVSRIQDADALVNNADTPFRFLPCMVAGLAYYLAMKKAPERVQLLKAVYEEEFQRAAAEDANSTPLKLTPSMTYYSY
jgi:hypothetical protein